MIKTIQDWQYYKKLYQSCTNNQEYLNVLRTKKQQIENLEDSLLSDVVVNQDLLLQTNKQLAEKFNQNQLITSRLGCVESRFILSYKFEESVVGDFEKLSDKDDDFRMKKNTGLYYVNPEDKHFILSWWCDNAIELLLNPITTAVSCYLVLAYDLQLLSILGIKNKIIGSYTEQTELIKLFKDRKILVISNGVDDMAKSYKLGMQRFYNFQIPFFEMQFLRCPQTTIGMEVPHKHIKETTEKIVEEINKKYHDFDTVLLCCGGYASPLINILSKSKNMNLLYFGSELYTFFGLYSDGIKKPLGREHIFNLNNFLEISKKCPEACKSIDNGKYWKI